MGNRFRIVLAGLLVTALAGCAVTVNDGAGAGHESDWRERQENNRDEIARLEIGMSLAEVRERLGRPDITEAFMRDGTEFRIYHYRTQHRRGDGKTTRDETTPLVFRDGRLEGWGDTLLRRIGAGG